jgi:hypothetical protein
MSASHSINNPGPESTAYDKMRREKMRLRPNGMYGIPKFFISGSAPSRDCDCGCGKLKVWCPNRESNK